MLDSTHIMYDENQVEEAFEAQAHEINNTKTEC